MGMAICVPLVLLWPIGVPAVLYYSMWSASDDIAAGDVPTLQKFDFVLGDFKREYWYWEVVELSRKLLLTGLMSLMMRGTITQVVVATVISFFYFAAAVACQPFEDHLLNVFKALSELQLFGILLICVVLQTNDKGIPEELGEGDLTTDHYGAIQVGLTLVILPASIFFLCVAIKDLNAESEAGSTGATSTTGGATTESIETYNPLNDGVEDKAE